jgi:hypothetical protein
MNEKQNSRQGAIKQAGSKINGHFFFIISMMHASWEPIFLLIESGQLEKEFA